jgi:hypothetical protein
VNTKMKVAFWLYVVGGVLPGFVFGFIYLLRNEFMPYHAVAVGMAWSEVPGPFQILIIALLKGVGGAAVTLAVALLVLLLVPFRHGARWALWAVPSLALLNYITVANAMAHVMLNTPAVPPWNVTVFCTACIIVGAILSIPSQSRAGGA